MLSLLHRRETGLDSPVKLYDAVKANKNFVQRLRLERRLEVHRGCVNTICWNESGTRLLSGSDDQHLVISDPYTGQTCASIRSGHHSNIFCAKFLPNSQDQEIVSCSGAGSIYYTQVDREDMYGKCLFDCHVGTTYELVVVPNEARTFLTCGEDGTVRWFDLRIKTSCNKERCKEDVLINCRSAVTSISVDPVLPYQLATACADGSVRVFDRRMLGTRLSGTYSSRVMTGLVSRFVAPLENQAHRITSLNYSPFSHDVLVSYSAENVYLFNTQLEESKELPKTDPDDETRGMMNGDEASGTAGADSTNQPPTKRLRLRGDWSDTGPNARPERERTEDTEGLPQVNLMQRMSDMLTRWLDGSMRRRGEEPGGDGASSAEDNPAQAQEGADRAAVDGTSSSSQSTQGETAVDGRAGRVGAHQDRPSSGTVDPVDERGELEARSSGDGRGCLEETGDEVDPVPMSVRKEGEVGEPGACGSGVEDLQQQAVPQNIATASDRSISGDKVRQSMCLPEPSGLSTVSSVTVSNPSISVNSVSQPSVNPLLSVSSVNQPSVNRSVSVSNVSQPSVNSSVSVCSVNQPSVNPSVSVSNVSQPSMNPSLSVNSVSKPSVNPPPDSSTGSHSCVMTDQDSPHSADLDLLNTSVSASVSLSNQRPMSTDLETFGSTEGLRTAEAASLTGQDSSHCEPFQSVSLSHTLPLSSPRSHIDIHLQEAERGHSSLVDPVSCLTVDDGAHCSDGPAVKAPTPNTMSGDRTTAAILNSPSCGQGTAATCSEPVVNLNRSEEGDSVDSSHGPNNVQMTAPEVADSGQEQASASTHRDVTAGSSSSRQRRVGHSGPPTGDFQLVVNDNIDEDSDEEDDSREGVRSRSVPFWSYGASSSDERHYAAMRMQSLYRRRMEEREKQAMAAVFQPQPLSMYTGHRNSRTMIKESNFWGDKVVMSGSDCGRIFLWDRDTTQLIMLLEADRHVVNCLQPHPFDPILASSGIDYDVKIWAPLEAEPSFDQEMAEEVMRRNHIMLEETRDTITVPAAFMLRVLASLNQIRAGRAGAGSGRQQEESPGDSD